MFLPYVTTPPMSPPTSPPTLLRSASVENSEDVKPSGSSRDATLKIFATVGLVAISLAVGTVLFFFASAVQLALLGPPPLVHVD
jgi:hypothetical protein